MSRFSAFFVITNGTDSVDSQFLFGREIRATASCKMRGSKLRISSLIPYEQTVWFCAPRVMLHITDDRYTMIFTSTARDHHWDSVRAYTTEGRHKTLEKKVIIKSKHKNSCPVWRLSASVEVSVLRHGLGSAVCELLRLAHSLSTWPGVRSKTHSPPLDSETKEKDGRRTRRG